ncbi:hypothetical protein M378DRAFT_78904 [Amanita muscaria Koide BX008]|uniref:CFEM domain-containing protein n=1 Tax=Amanita muscaria (strain Koide BX008) TaxID=946122 RepID=A0A0C2WQW9_AMAMK|nr:hypothetical protein M378DRAFT_78904 [Amanita muscaria Koide BX008]
MYAVFSWDKCVCTDVGFQTAAGQCLRQKCSDQDQQTGTQLHKRLCGYRSTTMHPILYLDVL